MFEELDKLTSQYAGTYTGINLYGETGPFEKIIEAWAGCRAHHDGPKKATDNRPPRRRHDGDEHAGTIIADGPVAVSGTILRPTYGHTNLVEYYSKLYGLTEERTDWKVPRATLGKLRLVPNFLTASNLMHAFLNRSVVPDLADRPIDLHARLGGTNASGSYGEMRRTAEKIVGDLGGVHHVMGSGVSYKTFMQEMRQSKICFSPFGYGEICWRDIEAFATGAVLIKPDMSHLRTEPDLFRDGETYVACSWDFSDLGEKIQTLCADDKMRHRIANRAWQEACTYLQTAGPVACYAPFLGGDLTGPEHI